MPTKRTAIVTGRSVPEVIAAHHSRYERAEQARPTFISPARAPSSCSGDGLVGRVCERRGRLPASWFRVLEVAPLSASGVATLRGSVPDALRAGERGLTLLFDDPAEGAFPVELDFGAIDQTDWGACL